MSDHQSEYLTTRQLAALLQTTEAAVRLRMYRGDIPPDCVIQGKRKGRLLFSRARIQKHLLANAGRAV